MVNNWDILTLNVHTRNFVFSRHIGITIWKGAH